MFFTVASALLFANNRRLVEIFPKGVKKVWNDWELRALILVSLILQTLLIALGNRRKDIPLTRLRIILWSAYLLADWVATVALGVISQNAFEVHDNFSLQIGPKASSESLGCNYTNEIMSFWAPFLLLHLGGPDTITAYSLEDNELWLRHLVGLVIQSGVALYIVLLAWPGCSWLPILSILMLGAGLFKYGERTWALMSANTENFRDSMLTEPEPGPNYPKFMEEYVLKKSEGYDVTAEGVSEPPLPLDHFSYHADKCKLISKAFDLFQTFRRLFVDLILTFQDLDGSQSYFRSLKSPKEAFHLVEVELGFAFDVLFTKAPVAYSFVGLLLRLATLSCTLTTFAGFVLLCDQVQYQKIDVIVTYLLLIVAAVLEISAFVIMLQSDWTDLWLSQHNQTREVLPFLKRPKQSRWSNSMAQYNLLSVSLEDHPVICSGIQRFLKIYEYREKHRYKKYAKVSEKLKDLIFHQLMKFLETGSNTNLRAVCTLRGSFSLSEENGCPPIEWSILKVEFDQSILIWHIATDLCYYMEVGDNDQNQSDNDSNRSLSKKLSDYMLYLLVMCPFMLPMGIGLIRYRDTCAEVMEFIKGRKDFSQKEGKAKVCKKLLDVNSDIPPSIVKGDRSKSVLFDACILAKSLRTMEEERKWVLISQVWVEILAYAATHCRGNYHAQQLRRGGELLTHVWLLMAHLGISEQFQVSQGHARAKLIVK